MRKRDDFNMAFFTKVVGKLLLTRLIMVEVNIVENGDIMDLRAKIWRFMYKPRSEVEGAST